MQAPAADSHVNTVCRPGILVVEDNSTLQNLLGDFFHLCGAPVWKANDGLQALSILQQEHKNISMVLLDIRMPKMDGFQVLREVKKIYPDLACCIMTGFANDYNDAELKEHGALRVYHKPFKSLPELAEEIIELSMQPVSESIDTSWPDQSERPKSDTPSVSRALQILRRRWHYDGQK